ncbi:hypothetical protein [Thalassococcus lentus]|uniref:Lipoprotein n=1 Tax=Thalassococcus lentus TaxID=1210524 RepID=A0ABT4XUT4_9RHOB|nr:hypothetical protein [Thalassococcus lentus]MDA7425715.1 hypothetical protein [Thalassococcus lentus]
MKRIPYFLAMAVLVPGCMQPDSFVSDDARTARQELRLQGYQHMSCSQLAQHRAAALPARSALGAISVTGGLGRQTLSDIEEMMRRKGCRIQG